MIIKLNPLDNVPLNTRRVYVVATAQSGCKVYMPVDTISPNIQHFKRDQLQDYLDNQVLLNPILPSAA